MSMQTTTQTATLMLLQGWQHNFDDVLLTDIDNPKQLSKQEGQDGPGSLTWFF